MSFDLVALLLKTKAQTIAIRCLGSPQATILYGEVCAKAQYPNKNRNSSFAFEVVIRQRLSYKKAHPVKDALQSY